MKIKTLLLTLLISTSLIGTSQALTFTNSNSSSNTNSKKSSINIDIEQFDGIILADEAKEMFDEHVQQSELLKVPLPSDNRVIKDYSRYQDYRKNILPNNFHFTHYLWKEEVNGQVLTKDVCMKVVSEFKVPTTPTKEEFVFKRCLAAFMDNSVIHFDDGIELYEELLLKIASAKNDKWVYKNSGRDDFNPRDYQLWGVFSTFVMFYAVNYDGFDYTNEERKVIENYFKSKAMKERLDRDGNRSRTSLCPIKDPMKLSANRHKVNNCESVRFRFAPAELSLAIVMQDQELWAKGLWDLDYTLSMIEKEGFFVPLSAKGCKALGYTWDTSKLLSFNVEMLKLADFNLLDYKTRHGKTIAEAYEVLFKQYEDITISNHIAKKAIGAWSCGEKPYKTHEEFVLWEYGGPAKLADAVKEGWVPNQEHFMTWSIRFVSEKHPDWLNGKNTPRDVYVSPWLSQYYIVQPFEIFNANIMSEDDGIWQEKERQLELDAKKEAAACKVSGLNGEYIATWFIQNVNKNCATCNKEPELRGSERLTFDKCVGQFEGAEGFHPSNELVKEQRKNLQVTLKTNGQITISGHIDIFGSGRGYPTVLKGDINSGEISGIW
ncbi:MAG: alginate lyase family protein, partial [PS1 clade bacterium]